MDLPDHHADLRALFVASETVEVRTAPPRTLVEGQAWVELPQMELAQANEAGQVQAFRVPPQPIGQLQNGWSMQKTWISRSCCWVAFPSPSNCLC